MVADRYPSRVKLRNLSDSPDSIGDYHPCHPSALTHDLPEALVWRVVVFAVAIEAQLWLK